MSEELERDDRKSPQSTAVVVVQEDVKKKWTSYVWDTFDKSPDERHFLFKLDFALLTFASLGMYSAQNECLGPATWRLTCEGYFIKYLDQANINNAFVSGMYVRRKITSICASLLTVVKERAVVTLWQ